MERSTALDGVEAGWAEIIADDWSAAVKAGLSGDCTDRTG